MDILWDVIKNFVIQLAGKVTITSSWGASLGILLFIFSTFLIKSSITFADNKEVNKKTEGAKAVSATTLKASPSQSHQQNTQICDKGNCFQGNNYGNLTMSQIQGPPKLIMSEEQKSTITQEMRPYAGLKFSIHRHTATPDSKDYSDKLRDALKDAGMICIIDDSPLMLPTPPSGISFYIGNERIGVAEALANILKKLNLQSETHGMRQENPDGFEIIVAPNR